MLEWTLAPLPAALGFVLGFFFMRAMRVADKLPERYVTKQDCRGLRTDCRRGLDAGRGELLERMDRIEAKLDRLAERMPGPGWVRQ